jgi:hypothetical protein
MAGMYSKMASRKIGKVMKEGMAGKLHSGKGGPIVKKPSQMKAIALSVARKRGMKVPARKPGMATTGQEVFKGQKTAGRSTLGSVVKRLAGKTF